ncbi:MAG TPA: PAS domain-containing protein [Actinomycetota bacterium]|nr:PAS domain-containing protein [Actinomycetota bacterium]
MLDLVQDLGAIVWEADAATRRHGFVSRRAEDVLGYPVDDWLADASFWADHLHPDDRDEAIRVCRTETDGSRDRVFEYRMIARDGSVVWIRDLVTVVPATSGTPRRICGLMVDVTARRPPNRNCGRARSGSADCRTPRSKVWPFTRRG